MERENVPELCSNSSWSYLTNYWMLGQMYVYLLFTCTYNIYFFQLFFFQSHSFPFCCRDCIKKQKPCIPWAILNLLWSFIIEGTNFALICRNSDWVFRSPKKQLKIQLEVSNMVFFDIRLFYFICLTWMW